MNGSLIFGGLDQAKMTVANLTQSFSSLDDMTVCPSSMIVYITNIIVKSSNGTSRSLFGPAEGSAMRACVKPDIPLITFPSSIFSAFSAAIGGTYIIPSDSYKLWGMDYAAAGVFDGDLPFTFSSGLGITVPNSQLVVPDVQINQAGQMNIPDSNTREILVYNLETSNVNDMPLLGQAFLTSAYLHVNNDNEEFVICQANPTKEQNLVAVGSQSICHQTTSNQTIFGGQSSSPTNSNRTLSAAAISLICIGIIVVIGLTVLALYYLCRKRQRTSEVTSKYSIWKKRSLTHDTYKEMATEIEGAHGYHQSAMAVRHEMPTYGHSPAQELVGREAPVYEMPAARWSVRTSEAQAGRGAIHGDLP